MSHRYDGLIATTMKQLTANVSDFTPLDTILGELTEAAVGLIDGVDCADVLMIRNGEFHSLAATSPVATLVDKAQKQTGQGPCLDAAERDVIVSCSDLRTDNRWPAFAQEAQAAGVLSVMSFRLYTEGADSGALNMFGFTAGSFTADPEAVGAMLATQAAVSIVAADRQRQFQSALASRDAIGQAKGIIMERFDVDAVRAFELLTRISQESNTPVRVIAERLTRRGPRRTPHADRLTQMFPAKGNNRFTRS